MGRPPRGGVLQFRFLPRDALASRGLCCVYVCEECFIPLRFIRAFEGVALEGLLTDARNIVGLARQPNA